MFMIGPIGFASPVLLLALLALPVLWLLLRAVPPAPARRRFPGVSLLLGLTDNTHETDKTPWWLLLLRMLAMAAAIIAFAGPVLNPRSSSPGSGPLLILADGTWADARDWPRRQQQISILLTQAARDGRPVALALASQPPKGPLQFQSADAARTELPNLTPNPWQPPPPQIIDWASAQDARFDTYWLSDGLARDGRAELLAALESRGDVRIFQSPRPIYALRPAQLRDGSLNLTVLRAQAGAPAQTDIAVIGTDPNGIERELARTSAEFTATDLQASATFDLPPELRNRIRRFVLPAHRSAAAVSLSDDGLKRREVALVRNRGDDSEAQDILSPLHYLRQALTPSTDLIEGDLSDLIPANPDVMVLADIATLSQLEEKQLLEWVAKGGLLLRFAGPRLAASDISRTSEDPLMPVRLRAGGRMVGGAMSWGEPKTLRPFPDSSPFFGLEVPDEVRVSAQVLAQPDPNLAERSIASLADGTPLVTRKSLAQGQVVLFHVTANAEWSSLPLSVLFVDMLDRLAVSSRPIDPGAADLSGQLWVPQQLLNAYGEISQADAMAGLPGEILAAGPRSATQPPGLYAGAERIVAMNVIGTQTPLSIAQWPARISIEGLTAAVETPLKGSALTLAILALLVDILASLWLAGRLHGPRSGIVATLVIGLMLPQQGRAEISEAQALEATTEVVLAYVITGDLRLDELSQAGLRGLSAQLTRRTAIEPAPPIGVSLETDELAFFPLLYWPVSTEQPLPTPQAYAKLNRYLRTGGMIVFDTRDANLGPAASRSPEASYFQRLALPLDIPPLEPVPHDHVLTRSFYLLQDFPGRYISRDVWVEAAPPQAEQAEGMPFRNLNDGVTPVVIGGNDWAAAWAITAAGNPSYPVGRGYAGEQQREVAYRFGINLVMHVLTGNYKSDQVHVPALLERLGQ